MKMVIMTLILIGIFANAKAVKSVEVKDAAYLATAADPMIYVLVTYKGCGGEEFKLNENMSCSKSKPFTCETQILGSPSSNCNRDIQKIVPEALETLTFENENLTAKKFQDSVIVINGTNSKATVQLRRD